MLAASPLPIVATGDCIGLYHPISISASLLLHKYTPLRFQHLGKWYLHTLFKIASEPIKYQFFSSLGIRPRFELQVIPLGIGLAAEGYILPVMCCSSLVSFLSTILLSSRFHRGDVGRSKLLQVSVHQSVFVYLCRHPSVFPRSCGSLV